MLRKLVAVLTVLVAATSLRGQLQSQKDAQLIEEAKMTQTVEELLRQVRRNLGVDSVGTIDSLQNALIDVRNHAHISISVRDALMSRLQVALREASVEANALKIAKHELTRSVEASIAKAGRIYLDYPDKSLELLRSTTFRVWDDAQISEEHREVLLSKLVAARAKVASQKGQNDRPAAAASKPALGPKFLGKHTQVKFSQPSGMKVSWKAAKKESGTIDVPGRHNFKRGETYHLQLSNIAGRPNLEVNASLQVMPGHAKTEEFLAHCAVTVEFTTEDFDQVVDGMYVVKVIYLPDPQFQELAGPGSIISTRLEPGQDPIEFARRRGTVVLIVRMGNKL